MIRFLKRNLNTLFHHLISLSSLVVGEPLFRLRGMRRGISLPELSQLGQILVIRLDQIGDFVMTTPLLRELRKNAPQARITLIVKPELHSLASACPYVDEVLTFNSHTSTRFLDIRRPSRALKFCVTHLWQRRFNLAIIPRWDGDWYYQTFLAYFSGSRWRIGYSEDVTPIKQIHNRGYDRLLTHALHRNILTHEVERNLAILQELGGTVRQTEAEIWSTAADDLWAQNWLEARNKPAGRPWIAVGPFAGNSVLKRWPLQRFAQLGRWLISVSGGHILILGGAGDQAEAHQLCVDIGARTSNAVGQCSLPQTIALLKHCSLYIGVDSGPMHLASAVGIPVIALFGPSCPHRFQPWTPKKQVLWTQLPCSPCKIQDHADCCTVCIFAQPHCIQSITVEEVQEAVKKAVVLDHLFFLPASRQYDLLN